MESELVCFPEPLNACFWLSFGKPAEPEETDADPLEPDSALPALNELFAEDWD